MAHEDQLKKLVSLDKLGLYHHTLLEKLGLVNDTAAFQYNGGRSDFDTVFPGGEGKLDPTKINDVVSGIYDLAKAGAIEFATGKYIKDETHTLTPKEVEFDSKDGADTNEYWIHAQVGDDVVNIKLDANDFVKDSFLEKVQLVAVVEEEVEGEKVISYIVDGGDASTVAPEGFDETTPGTYFFYTWKLEKGEAGEEYSYTVIAVKDIYGDLKADEDYIHFDKTTNEFSALTNEVVAVNGKDPETQEPTDEIVGWEVSDSAAEGLATAENLASVADNLQKQLNAAIEKLTLEDGVVTLDDSADSSTLVYSADDNRYELTLAIAGSDEITDLFVQCPAPEPKP